uniref:Uncharacterized protein n=1 Tax=Erpetoichthys calabaricus TaxID=27687 RepID=A0A8C4SGD4_ERPCA
MVFCNTAPLLCVFLSRGPVSKHFVTEEQMATRFTCLSLNNDHCYASTGFPAQPGHCHGLEPCLLDKEKQLSFDPKGSVVLHPCVAHI